MRSNFFHPGSTSTFRSSTSIAVFAAALFGALIVLSMTTTQAKPDPASKVGKIGKMPREAAANYQIRTFDGKNFSLASLRGKVVVLDFFAIWCGHSKQHIPSMTEYGEAEAKRGLQIIGLAVKDADSSVDNVKKFIAEQHIDYPVGMIADPDFVQFVESKDVSVPQTLVIGRDGRIAAHFTGHNKQTERELADVIQRELEKN
jgi:peroxiredoxin